MKVGVMMLLVSVSAILSCGDGVPTLVPASANTSEEISVTDGNNNTFTPITNLNSSGLNPKHGEPGHRCDIGVGQPLSSIPSKQPSKQPSMLFNPVTIERLNPPHGQPGHRHDIEVGQPLNSNPSQPTTSPTNTLTTNSTPVAPGMNPPHGQPGHRHDIQVGQPLDSKPTLPTTSPTSTPATNSTTVIPATNSTPVAPGMNPPHGQPGHRCDIQVGQPLNSKPTLPTTSSTGTPATNTTTVTPITNTATVANGLNPKHGQPGHRCDILVGQPLNSNPSQPTTAPTTTPTTNTTTATPTTNTAIVAPWLNPKHGQPGHRCDIKVGQPLNSKPAQTSSPTAPVTP